MIVVVDSVPSDLAKVNVSRTVCHVSSGAPIRKNV
jgi:hypothetical protein